MYSICHSIAYAEAGKSANSLIHSNASRTYVYLMFWLYKNSISTTSKQSFWYKFNKHNQSFYIRNYLAQEFYSITRMNKRLIEL